MKDIDLAIFIPVIIALIAPLSSLVMRIVNRKKYNAENYSTVSNANQTNVETMQMIINELRTELDKAYKKIDSLTEQVDRLMKSPEK